MPEFKSWRSYQDFEQAIKHRTRYVHDPEVWEFLEAIQATCQNRIETIPEASFLWRAQLGHAWEPFYQDGEHIYDSPAPYPPERMKPLTGRAVEGRANPKGIPYLSILKSPLLRSEKSRSGATLTERLLNQSIGATILPTTRLHR